MIAFGQSRHCVGRRRPRRRCCKVGSGRNPVLAFAWMSEVEGGNNHSNQAESAAPPEVPQGITISRKSEGQETLPSLTCGRAPVPPVEPPYTSFSTVLALLSSPCPLTRGHRGRHRMRFVIDSHLFPVAVGLLGLDSLRAMPVGMIPSSLIASLACAQSLCTGHIIPAVMHMVESFFLLLFRYHQCCNCWYCCRCC
jgi:hypothetical protein